MALALALKGSLAGCWLWRVLLTQQQGACTPHIRMRSGASVHSALDSPPHSKLKPRQEQGWGPASILTSWPGPFKVPGRWTAAHGPPSAPRALGSPPITCSLGSFEALGALSPFLYHCPPPQIILHISLSDPVMYVGAETGSSSVARNDVCLIDCAPAGSTVRGTQHVLRNHWLNQ